MIVESTILRLREQRDNVIGTAAMNPERRRQVEELCGAVLEREPRERTAFLVDACKGDEELRQAVESLLAGGADLPQGR
jgi:hypothetical protein